MSFLENLFPKPEVRLSPGNIKPVVLLILDGWGLAPDSTGNAIAHAKKPNMDSINATYPHGELVASGESVGLPANEVGNTEVGHLNLGAGRIILQDLKRISKAIKDGDFFENKALRDAAEHAKKNNSKFHIIGLASTGNVHSSMEHFWALLDFCRRQQLTQVYLHLFTDGRDAAPKEGIEVIKQIEEYTKTNGIGKIATIGGRYFGMDRDRRWDRVEKAYKAMVQGIGPTAKSGVEAMNASYAAEKTDEFVEPTVIVDQAGKPTAMIGNNDAAVFFNYRIDRPRELTMAMTVADFTKANISWEFDPYAVKYGQKHANEKAEVQASEPFKRGVIPQNLFFVTMTQYQRNIPASAIAFPPQVIDFGLTQVIAQASLKQMHMSESEKERFVTYYFDGLKEDKVPGEDVLIVPSPRVPTYDKKPQMSVLDLAYEFKKVLAKDTYSFVVMNFANADMVGHTGNIKAATKAVEYVDKAVGEVVKAVLAVDGTLLITADHGNAEEMITFANANFFFTTDKGSANTDHSNNPVPIIIVKKGFENQVKTISKGISGDVAPTILALMGLPIPPAMTGKNLLVQEDLSKK